MDDLDALLAARAQQTQADPLDAMLQSRAQGGSVVPPAPQAPPAGFNGGLVSGGIQGLRDLQNGGAQWLYNNLPQPLRDAGDAADHWLFDKTGGAVGTKPGMSFNNAVADQNNGYEVGRQANGRDGIDWTRVLGNATGQAGLSLTGLPAAGGVASGILSGALAPVTSDGNYWTQKAQDLVTGGAFGKATDVVGNTVASVVKPALRKEAQTLVDAGVQLTPGQLLGGALKRTEDGLTSIPVLGDLIRNSQRRSFESLNTATFNRALAPLGEKLPSSLTGRDAVNYVGRRLGDEYESVLDKMGALHPDATFSHDLASLSQLTQNLPKDAADQFQTIIKNEILARIDKNGVMTPQGMKAAESNLGSISSGYLKDQGYDTRQLGAAIQEAQATLRSMVQRVAPPQYATALQKVNEGWANFVRAQRASSSIGAEGGVFTPAQLQSAVRALDPSRNKGAFARGDALLQDLSDSAKSVMGNKVPDSGTPYRSAVGVGAGMVVGHSVPAVATLAAPFVAPAAAIGGAAALPYTKLGQGALNAVVGMQRPAGAQALADLLRKGTDKANAPISAGMLSLIRSLQQ